MRILLYTSLFLLFFGCSAPHKITDIYFYDSYEKKYQLSLFSETIKKEYNLNDKPKIIFVATSSADIKKYKDQMNILHVINAEEMSYLYVIANSNKEDRSGYFTDQSDAEKILSGKEFKIIIFNEQGKTIKESEQVLGKKDIISHLIKNSNGR